MIDLIFPLLVEWGSEFSQNLLRSNFSFLIGGGGMCLDAFFEICKVERGGVCFSIDYFCCLQRV